MPSIHRPAATASRVRMLLGTDPFLVAAALDAGFTEGQLRAARGAGWLERVRHGVLALPPAPEDDAVRRQALAALLVLAPGAVVRGTTAGLLQGLPGRRPGERPGDVVVSGPRTGRRRAGIHVIEGHLDEVDVVDVGGVRCSSLARTALDLALGRPLAESLVVLDAAIAREGPGSVSSALARFDRRRGLDELRRAVDLADARSESPLESASRGAVLGADLPAPELQQWVVDDTGRAWRVDFLWRAHRVIGEADGWGKYASIDDVRAEKRREDALRRAGWTIVRWTSDELWRTPATVVARIARALGR